MSLTTRIAGALLALLGIGAGTSAILVFIDVTRNRHLNPGGALLSACVIGVPGVYSACRGIYLARTGGRRASAPPAPADSRS